jgi:3-oxoacyl-[acyl-carrier protein] reductase
MTFDEFKANCDEKAIAVFYGAGSLYRECAEQLHQLISNHKVFVIDQKYLNANDVFDNGIPCFGPEVLTVLSRSTLIVICTRNHFVVANDLKVMGFYNIKYAQFDLCKVRVKCLLDYPSSSNVLCSHEVTFGGRTALITGSTRGIGLEIAVALGLRGVRVILHGRTEGSLQEGLRCFEERTSTKTVGIVADLNHHSASELILHYLLSNNICIDILYNNAGISPPTINGPYAAYANNFDACMTVNFRSVVELTSLLLPKMLEYGYGRIIFLTSMSSGQPDQIPYICSKAALTCYASELTNLTNGTAVRVSTLDPGWVRSDMGGESATRAVYTVIPGALIGALALPIENGIWVTAQDYAGLTDGQLMKKIYIDGYLKQE